jgi:hypothetical protein
MNERLPDAPESLRGAARAFYDELRAMLAEVRASQLDIERSAVDFEEDGLELTLQHRSQPDVTIWATVGERDSIIAVGSGGAHEHFFAPKPGEKEQRPWTTAMVDFIAAALRGEIEIETTLRGNAVLSVRHYNVDEQGQRQQLGSTHLLHPGRLLAWRPKASRN